MSRPALTAYRFPTRTRVVRPQLQPDAVRLYYYSSLRALVSKAHALVTAELLPLVGELRTDSVDGERVKHAVADLAKRFAPSMAPGRLRPLAAQVAQRTADFQKTQLQAQLKSVIGASPLIRDAGLAEAADAFTETNVALVRTIPARYFSSLSDTVVQGINGGARASTIAKDIEERYQVSESNAARIANDQVGKFFGALNQTRQVELGITRYVWGTAHDNRVRPDHRELDGKTFGWDDQPLGGGTDEAEAGHPGSGINCRCSALPDISGLLD